MDLQYPMRRSTSTTAGVQPTPNLSQFSLDEIRWVLLGLLHRCGIDLHVYHQLLPALLPLNAAQSATLHSALCAQLAFSALLSTHGVPCRVRSGRNGNAKFNRPAKQHSAARAYLQLNLEDIRTRVLAFAKDQHGSRFIQERLGSVEADVKQMIFDELAPEMCLLFNHKYANYVVQKYFEIGSDEQKLFLVQKLQGNVLYLTLEVYGCRVIQKAVETLPPEFQAEIISELDGHMLQCVMDNNGNHVIQKCIRFADPILLQSMITSFIGKFYEMAVHPFGCRVVQRILENGNSKTLESVLPEILDRTYDLILNQYGNYVIQHIIVNGSSDKRSEIVSALQGHVYILSQHKFASNVVEKCLVHSSHKERFQLIQEFYEPDSNLLTLMKDPYANYVLQRAIERAQPSQRKVLVDRMRPYLDKVRKYMYAKHVVTKVDRIVAQGTC